MDLKQLKSFSLQKGNWQYFNLRKIFWSLEAFSKFLKGTDPEMAQIKSQSPYMSDWSDGMN